MNENMSNNRAWICHLDWARVHKGYQPRSPPSTNHLLKQAFTLSALLSHTIAVAFLFTRLTWLLQPQPIFLYPRLKWINIFPPPIYITLRLHMTASPPLTQFMPWHLPDASKCHPHSSSQGQKAAHDRGQKREEGFVACRPDEFHLSTAKAIRESCGKGRWRRKLWMYRIL